MLTLPQPLAPMAAYHDFILWDVAWDATKQKYSKRPVNPHTGHPFPKGGGWQQDPSQRVSFDVAAAAAKKWDLKVGGR